MRNVAVALVSGYLGAGVFGGLLIMQSIPAMNAFGLGYIALTWPRLIYCAPVIRGCDPMPPEWLGKYMFNFD